MSEQNPRVGLSTQRDEQTIAEFRSVVESNRDVLPCLDSELPAMADRLRNEVVGRVVAELAQEMVDDRLASPEDGDEGEAATDDEPAEEPEQEQSEQA